MKLPIIIPAKLYWDKHDIPTSKDRLLRDYNIVLMESAIMASFDGFFIWISLEYIGQKYESFDVH